MNGRYGRRPPVDDCQGPNSNETGKLGTKLRRKANYGPRSAAAAGLKSAVNQCQKPATGQKDRNPRPEEGFQEPSCCEAELKKSRGQEDQGPELGRSRPDEDSGAAHIAAPKRCLGFGFKSLLGVVIKRSLMVTPQRCIKATGTLGLRTVGEEVLQLRGQHTLNDDKVVNDKANRKQTSRRRACMDQ